MPLVKFKIFGEAEDGLPIKQIGVECDFLPRVGDVFNTFDLFDDIKVEGNHFSIVYDIEWSMEGNRGVPIVKLVKDQGGGHRLDILDRHGWLPHERNSDAERARA